MLNSIESLAHFIKKFLEHLLLANCLLRQWKLETDLINYIWATEKDFIPTASLAKIDTTILTLSNKQACYPHTE
jgi:hypothetical protein